MRKLEVVLTLALLGSAAASLWLWTELRAEHIRTAELTARLETSTPSSKMAVESVVENPTADPVSTSTTLAHTSEPAVAPPSNTVRVPQEDEAANERRLLRDPKYREAWREQERQLYAPRRENLIRLLGLTPQQADAVLDVSIERHLQWIYYDEPDAMTPEGLKQQNEWEAAGEAADQKKLGELLGEEKRAQLQTYMESRGARMQVDTFRGQLPAADALRDDQVEPLIAALHVEHAQMRQQMDEFSTSLDPAMDPNKASELYAKRQSELMKERNQRVHTAAAPILSASQLQKLDELLRRDRQKIEAQQRLSLLQQRIDLPGAATGAN